MRAYVYACVRVCVRTCTRACTCACYSHFTHGVVRYLRAQLLDLLAQLPDELDVGVLVDGGLVDDVLGAVRVPQRRQRLAVVAVRWRYLRTNT